MAGHSHFKNIKRKKEASDKKRAALFSKASRLIISAVREGGEDPQFNPSLRFAIEKAKEVDMPKSNIERAIKRGLGQGEKGKLEPFIFEAYGPDNIAIIIEGNTENNNKTVDEVKKIIKDNDGKLADPGSVKWLFEKKGLIEIEKEKENNSILDFIDDSIDDIEEKEDCFVIFVPLEKIKEIKLLLEKEGFQINSAKPAWKPKAKINPTSNKYKKLIDDLLDNGSIEDVYINI